VRVWIRGESTVTDAAGALEERIEEFALDFEYDDLNPDDRWATKALLKDNLAVAIGLSVLPWSRAADRYAREQEREGVSTVAASGREVDPGTAAFLNATYIHGFEYDDAHGPSDGHPGSVATATALAVGEDADATVGETLAALVAAYEVYTRIGAAASPTLIGRGWHAHAVLGNFGAATAAAKLWDLGAEELRYALAIAASHASGLTEYSSTGGSIKRAHAGMAARNGIQAARMAKNGVTGPRRYLTGNKGFFQTFIEKSDIAAADFADLDDLRLHETWLKQYACCGCTHAYIDGVHAIDPDLEDIETVKARIQPKSDSIVGTANENLYAPSTIEEAQFNLPFEVALALLEHGNGFETHRKIVSGDLALDEPELRETMQLIELDPDPSIGEEYDSKFVGDLTVHYEDGSSEQAFVEDATGTPENQPTEAESREKFRELTLEILGEYGVEDLWNFVDDAGAERSIAEVTSLIH
jgi:2-methylcitrate dehydratase PrpD